LKHSAKISAVFIPGKFGRIFLRKLASIFGRNYRRNTRSNILPGNLAETKRNTRIDPWGEHSTV
jgi:hypothetical protein